MTAGNEVVNLFADIFFGQLLSISFREKSVKNRHFTTIFQHFTDADAFLVCFGSKNRSTFADDLNI